MEETCSVLELAWLNSLSPVVLTQSMPMSLPIEVVAIFIFQQHSAVSGSCEQLSEPNCYIHLCRVLFNYVIKTLSNCMCITT